MESPLREWSESRRLRLGTIIIVALLWSYGLLTVDEAIESRKEDITTLEQQNEDLAKLARGQKSMQLQEESRRRLSDFRARVWREESEGRIQAAFQDWLQGLLAQQNLQARELNVSILTQPPIAQAEDNRVSKRLPPEIRLVRAHLLLDFHPQQFVGLLAAFAESKHWVWTERLKIRNWGSPQLELELGALFAIGAKDKS